MIRVVDFTFIVLFFFVIFIIFLFLILLFFILFMEENIDDQEVREKSITNISTFIR